MKAPPINLEGKANMDSNEVVHQRKGRGTRSIQVCLALLLRLIFFSLINNYSLTHTDTVYWIGRAKIDDSTGRKLYRAFHLNGCKYERGDCVYLIAPPDPKATLGTPLCLHAQ